MKSTYIPILFFVFSSLLFAFSIKASSNGIITMGARITGVGDPTGPSDAATKAYIDSTVPAEPSWAFRSAVSTISKPLSCPSGTVIRGFRQLCASTAFGFLDVNNTSQSAVSPIGLTSWDQGENCAGTNSSYAIICSK